MSDNDEVRSLVLVVDDDSFTRTFHEAILSPAYRVEIAASGLEAVEKCQDLNPDLIVLDIEMADLDGYATCRKIRESNSVPVLFVSAHSSLESQLEAFEAGANDIITKPVAKEVFLHKVGLAIRTHRQYLNVLEEKESLQTMAMNFLSSVGETGVLLNFLRSSIACQRYEDLAQNFVDAARALQIDCFGVIRTADGNFDFRSTGQPSNLEQDVLTKLQSMGRMFQFNKRLVVNYDKVSVVVTNLPFESAEKAGGAKDNLCVLAETTEVLCENVGMRQESLRRAERLQRALIGAVAAVNSLQHDHRLMLADTRVLLQDLVEEIERAFSWLGTTSDQESAISAMTNNSVQAILDLLVTRGEFGNQFAAVLQALRGTQEKQAT